MAIFMQILSLRLYFFFISYTHILPCLNGFFLKRTWEKFFPSSSFFHMNFRMWIYYDFNSHQEKKIIRTCNTFKKYFFCHIIDDIFHERERWKRKLYSCIYINFFTSILKINTKKVPMEDEFCKHTGGWTINVSLLFWVKKSSFLFIHSACAL